MSSCCACRVCNPIIIIIIIKKKHTLHHCHILSHFPRYLILLYVTPPVRGHAFFLRNASGRSSGVSQSVAHWSPAGLHCSPACLGAFMCASRVSIRVFPHIYLHTHTHTSTRTQSHTDGLADGRTDGQTDAPEEMSLSPLRLVSPRRRSGTGTCITDGSR